MEKGGVSLSRFILRKQEVLQEQGSLALCIFSKIEYHPSHIVIEIILLCVNASRCPCVESKEK